MTIRQWQRLGYKAFVSGLLAWSGAGTLAAQTAPREPIATQETAPLRRNYMNKNVVASSSALHPLASSRERA